MLNEISLKTHVGKVNENIAIEELYCIDYKFSSSDSQNKGINLFGSIPYIFIQKIGYSANNIREV